MPENPYTNWITRGDPIQWRDREWTPVTEAMVPNEMLTYLRGSYYSHDWVSARDIAAGGTFDVTTWPHGASNGTFHTYTVANAHGGLVRLYKATDTRDLRDGRTW